MQRAPEVEGSSISRLQGWTRADWFAASAITIIGGLLRAVRLTVPHRGIGDEGFYGADACWYALSSKTCGIGHEKNLEHPPLGKWIISLPIKLFGYEIWTQRILAVVFGTVTILLLYMLARRLLGSTLGASIASGLLAIDFLHFIHSRVAMLDIFLVFFAELAFLFLVYDRDRLFNDPPLPGIRPWRLAAGAAAGAAAATKWTGLLVLVGVAFLSFVWDVHRRRGEERFFVRALAEEGPGLLLAFAIVPLVLYTITFAGRVHGSLFAWPGNETAWLNAWWDRQVHIFRFHAHAVFEHRFASEPWSWPLAKRGIPFMYLPKAGGGTVRAVIDAGNPVIWVLSLAAVVYVGFRWIGKQDPQRPEGVILAGFGWAYLPWLVYYFVPYLFFTWGRVALFVWYLLPALPFMYLAMGYAAVDLAKRFAGRVVVAVVTIFAVAAFAYYYPIMTFVPISQPAFDRRVIAFDNCARPKSAPFVFFENITVNGRTRFERHEAPGGSLLPPIGWCWLP